MSLIKKRYQKPLYLGLALFIVSLTLISINLWCSNCFKGNWAKILLSLCTVLIAVIELGDIFKNKYYKKVALYILVIALFLANVWDTGKESIDYQKEVDKRDSLITVDSLRFARIVNDLRTNIIQLEHISGSVVNSLNEVVNVKKSVGQQKPILENILNSTLDSKGKTRQLINAKKAKPSFYGRFTKGFFKSDSLNIEIHPVNVGNSRLLNVDIFYQIMFLEKIDDPLKTGVSLVYDCNNSGKLYPKKWTKLADVLDPNVTSLEMTTVLKPCLTKKDFKTEDNKWVLVYSIRGLDDFTQTEVRKTLTIIGVLRKDKTFNLQYNNVDLKVIKEYFENSFNLGEYIFSE